MNTNDKQTFLFLLSLGTDISFNNRVSSALWIKPDSQREKSVFHVMLLIVWKRGSKVYEIYPILWLCAIISLCLPALNIKSN